MTQHNTEEIEIEDRETYQCDHCGAESFGLIVEHGVAVGARCHLCHSIVFFDGETDE